MTTEERIEQLIDNKETEFILDMLESTSFEVRKDARGKYAVYDEVREEIYADGLDTASDVMKALSTYIRNNILNYLCMEARGNIKDFPNTCEEWHEAVARPDLQDFIKNHESEVAEIVLLAYPERIDGKVNIEDIVTEITKNECKDKA